MPWSTRYFNNDNTNGPVKVWARVNQNDEIVLDDGLVPFRYENDEDATVYTASPNNIAESPEDHEDEEDAEDNSLQFLRDSYRSTRRETTTPPDDVRSVDEPDSGVVEIHTDGASHKSSGSKAGAAGLGVVVRSGNDYREISQYLGTASNQVAELAALYVGLEAVDDPSAPVRVYTDSKYARGMLVEDWDVNANEKLVHKLRDLGDQFDDLEIHWIEGHSGDPLNERADDLATKAVNRNS